MEWRNACFLRRTMAAVESHSPGGEDKLCIEMLGAGQEVGRSCCVIRFKGTSFVIHTRFYGRL